MAKQLKSELAEQGVRLVWDGAAYVEAQHGSGRHYFAVGPLSSRWVFHAMRLPGKALTVAMLVAWRRKMCKDDDVVSVPGWLLNECQVSRQAYARALLELEQAGLVMVVHRIGRPTLVSLIGHLPE
jgi:hypothetical protein